MYSGAGFGQLLGLSQRRLLVSQAMGKKDEEKQRRRNKKEREKSKKLKNKKYKKSSDKTTPKKRTRMPHSLKPPVTAEELEAARKEAVEYPHCKNPRMTLADCLDEAAKGFNFADYNYPTTQGPRPTTVGELLVRQRRKGE